MKKIISLVLLSCCLFGSTFAVKDTGFGDLMRMNQNRIPKSHIGKIVAKMAAIFEADFDNEGIENIDKKLETFKKNLSEEVKKQKIKFDDYKAPIGKGSMIMLFFQASSDINKSNGVKGVSQDGYKTTGIPSHFTRVRKHYEDMIDWFVKQGVSINAANKRNETALYQAIQSLWPNMVKVILKHDEKLPIEQRSINKQFTFSKQAPLHIASIIGNPKMIELLTKYKANVDIEDMLEETALHKIIFQERKMVEGKELLIPVKDKIKIIQMLLDNGADINKKNNYGETPLALAVARGNENIIKFLIFKEANTDIKDNKGNNLIHIAAQSGNLEILKLVLKLFENNIKEKINKKNASGKTPLILAAENGYKNIIVFLLEKGSDPNIQDNKGNTSFLAATKKGDIEILQILRNDPFTQIGIPNSAGETSLHIAVKNKNIKAVKFLLKGEANPNKQNNNGDTSLHIAVKNEILEMFPILLKHPAVDKHKQNNYKETPLHVSIKNGKEKLVLELLKYFPQQIILGRTKAPRRDINKKDSNGHTTLHLASKNNFFEVADFLVNNGAEIDALANNKRTSLSYAAEKGNIKIATILVNNDADVTIKDNSGFSPRDYSKQKNKFEVLALLNKKYNKMKKKEVFESYKKLPKEIEKIDPNTGDTLLHQAIDAEHQELISILLKRKPKLVQKQNKKEETPLHTSIKKRNKYFFDILIKEAKEYIYSAIAKKDNEGNNPLHLAANFGKSKIITELLEINPDERNAKNNNWNTPLHIASKVDAVETAEVLIAKKANINAQNKKGNTPLHIAAEKGNFNMVRHLLGYEELKHKIKNKAKQTPLQLVKQIIKKIKEIEKIEENKEFKKYKEILKLLKMKKSKRKSFF